MFGSRSGSKKETPPAFVQGEIDPVLPEPDEEDYPHAMKELEQQRQNWKAFLRNKKDIWSEKWLWDGSIRAEMSSNHLKKKFMQMFSWKVKMQKQVKFLVRGGVPPELRGNVWWACSGAAEKKQSAAPDEQYQVLLGRIGELDGTRMALDIEKDLLRTFPERINVGNSGTVDALRRCLRAYALRNPVVGYCQSMNYICALLMFHMSEEQAFWVFSCMIEDIIPPDYYSPSLIGGRVDQQVFQSCIAWKLPKLYSVFKDTGTMLEPIICPWFLCLYINVLPLSVVCRVWDCMFWEGNVVLFRIGLTLMKSKSKYIIEANDFVAIYTILKVSNNKTYSFELESRDKEGSSPTTPGDAALADLPPPPPMGGLDILQDLGSISRAEFLINSAFGFRWLRSVPKAQVELLRGKFLALLEGDRAERAVSGGRAPSLGLITESTKPASSPTTLSGRLQGLFRSTSSHNISDSPKSPGSSGKHQSTPRQQTGSQSPSRPASQSQTETRAPVEIQRTPSEEASALAGEKAELAETISKHQSMKTSAGNPTGGKSPVRGGRSRQSLAMLRLLDELDINSLRSLAMDLDEGLGSHVEEFARQMETPQGPGAKFAAASADDDDDSDYGDFDEDEFGDIDVNKK